MQEMKKLNRWILHKDKHPYSCDSGKPVASNRDTDGISYKDIVKAYKNNEDFDGIGFRIIPPYVGIDLDHCLYNNAIAPYAKEIFETLDSYTELSPSGTGLHIIVKTKEPLKLTGLNCHFEDPQGARYNIKGRYGFELYTKGRFFTYTNNIYKGHKQIREVDTDIITDFYNQYKAVKDSGKKDSTQADIIPEGERNNTLYSLMWSYAYANNGATAEQIRDYIISVNETRCNPPIDDRELEASLLSQADSIAKKAPIQKREEMLRDFQGEFDTPSGEVDQAQAVINKWNSQLKQQPEKLYKSVGSEQESFDKYIREHKRRISTGFLELDKALNGGLDNELYILGAETGQGKSAFSMQLAQNIASAGTDVLYFALEMSRRELIARGVSCYSDKYKDITGKDPVTAGAILYYQYDELLEDFARESPEAYKEAQELYFKECGEHLFIVENKKERLDVDKIAETVRTFKEERGHYPVVFVDYLQMINFSKGTKEGGDRKNKTDNSIGVLKVISYRTPVFVISSIGRVGYGKRITTSSFKESGDIEYTGGILLGLNFSPDMKQFKKPVTGKIIYDEEKLEKAARALDRAMDIEVLKYRNGVKNNSIEFFYRARYNNFICLTDNDCMYWDDRKGIFRLG